MAPATDFAKPPGPDWSRRRLLAWFAVAGAGALLAGCQAAAAKAPASPPTVAQLPPSAAGQAGPSLEPSSVPTAPASPSVARAELATLAPATATPSAPLSAVPAKSTTFATPTPLRPDGPPHDPGPLTWAHPGPYISRAFDRSYVTSFAPDRPLVTAYYFYWDDLTNPAHQDPDRRFHPLDSAHYSFLNPATHYQQFSDMQAAGVDFALAVYWGEPGHPGRTWNPTPGHFWSTEGIPPMVQALDRLAAAGRPFKIGMFYDTTILANADLTTTNGQNYFYVNVRDFYSRFPPQHWATIGGKPVVWLYDTQWVAKFDPGTFDNLGQQFARDFGGLGLYLVREQQWNQSKGVRPPQPIHTENVYAWGAAPFGFNPDPSLGVAEVGPGFDNTADCDGRTGGGCFRVDRQNGAYYARELAAALRSGRKLLAIETWNEFDESTGIAATVEYGRTYIDLTRRYVDAFHAGRATLS